LIAEDISWDEFETISTPHDGPDGVAFVVDDGRSRLDILADLGHVFSLLEQVIGTLDAVLLESNNDPAMPAGGPYPTLLKQRIASSGGHLSNLEAASLLSSVTKGQLPWACLGHLSEQYNSRSWPCGPTAGFSEPVSRCLSPAGTTLVTCWKCDGGESSAGRRLRIWCSGVGRAGCLHRCPACHVSPHLVW
jgi:hypothetical protein